MALILCIIYSAVLNYSERVEPLTNKNTEELIIGKHFPDASDDSLLTAITFFDGVVPHHCRHLPPALNTNPGGSRSVCLLHLIHFSSLYPPTRVNVNAHKGRWV